MLVLVRMVVLGNSVHLLHTYLGEHSLDLETIELERFREGIHSKFSLTIAVTHLPIRLIHASGQLGRCWSSLDGTKTWRRERKN